MDPARRSWARDLLQEVVYRSRARQAAGAGLAGGRLDQPVGPGGCGLGEAAAVELDLSDSGRELFQSLWPDPPDTAELARIRSILDRWVHRQDALDRKRNHYLKDFRRQHGFERRAYPPEVLAAFEDGLGRINAEVNDELEATAGELAP